MNKLRILANYFIFIWFRDLSINLIDTLVFGNEFNSNISRIAKKLISNIINYFEK